ncbi:putative peptidoglycan lipid II flippase [Thermocatellispora tengchongensis]|uniref:Probable lipid II flippase MurJ n=1 Tax=Thermocatellispora tengchongensis TaxID=1073253 RepID=A0A840NSC6_9ACTN|nr:murein biosynthesis integral membrane protein MurJ [Thermocatellispora tengchongensis]MBB5130478.1 putative peptidoglycan lipid II flippase [Thermocatellispora tengchongensis]
MSRVLRAGAIMAAGTLVSRVTGFLRTAVLAAAIGTAALGDAYNVAYTIPLILFDLLIGGVLSSVIVPMIVRAQRNDPDGGRAYEQRLMTLAILALTAVAVLAVALAPQIVDLYTDDWTGPKREAAVTLARFILPQIAFFGIGALAGAILNTRDRFAAPMWAPVLNNLVMIAVGLLYLVVSDAGSAVEEVTRSDLALLGLGTTAGIVVQCLALVISLHRVGFRFRPRFDLRNAGLGEMGRTATWTFAYVGISQASFWVTTKLATGAGDMAPGAGNAAYSYAWQLFQLPYGIIAVSVITAMLPRMSRSVADGQYDMVREEFSSGVRLVSSVIVPSGLLLMVLGPALTVIIFGHGNMTTQDAIYIGNVLQVFGLALVPFSVFQLLLRVFYSFGDTRTPALIALANAAVSAGLSLLAYLTLPAEYIVMGLAFSFTVTYIAGGTITWMLASRRVGGLDGRRVAASLTRMYVAAIPTAALALAVLWAVETFAGLTLLSSLIILVAGGGLGGLLYLAISHRMRIPEIRSIVGLVAGRLGRG